MLKWKKRGVGKHKLENKSTPVDPKLLSSQFIPTPPFLHSRCFTLRAQRLLLLGFFPFISFALLFFFSWGVFMCTMGCEKEEIYPGGVKGK